MRGDRGLRRLLLQQDGLPLRVLDYLKWFLELWRVMRGGSQSGLDTCDGACGVVGSVWGTYREMTEMCMH